MAVPPASDKKWAKYVLGPFYDSDDDKEPNTPSLLLLVLFSLLAGVLLAWSVSDIFWRREAVDRGHAEWVTNDKGQRYWRWKDG
jgi:hypothetical protein